MQLPLLSNVSRWAERIGHPLLLWSGAGIGALVVIFAIVAWQAQDEALHRAERTVSTIDALAVQKLEREVALYDLALRETVEAAKAAAPGETAGLRKAMTAYAVMLQGLGSLVLVDATGSVVADLAEKDSEESPDFALFQSIKSLHGEGDLVVGRPIKVDDDWRVGLGRGIVRSDGTFAGAVLATLRTSAIEASLARASTALKGTITLSGLGGVVLAQVPRTADLAAFAADRPDPEAIESARPVGRWPLVLTTSVPRSHVLRPLRERLAVVGLAVAVVLGAMFSFLARAVRELSRRAAADRAMAGLAKTDSLTGLANRRAFDERLDAEWRRAERDASQLSLLMVDGDCFKAFNDTFGHIEGDRCLKSLADMLRQALKRPGDFAARYGGEEFAVLLPASDAATAERVAEDIRQSVMSLHIDHPHAPWGVVTVSVGLATVKPRYIGHPLELLLAADHALYEAKSSGRNRVMVAASVVPEAAADSQCSVRDDDDAALLVSQFEG